MTQEDAAHRLRSRGHKTTALGISRWERGSNEPRAGVIPDLASVYGVSIDEMYGDEEDEDEAEVIVRLASAAAERGDYAAAHDLYALLKSRAVAKAVA